MSQNVRKKNNFSLATNHLIQKNELAEGDLVFRAGHDMISQIVLSQSDDPIFSHVGILIKHQNTWFIVHSIPKTSSSSSGVILEILDDFISPENALRVGFFRHKNLKKDNLLLKEFLLQQIGKPFDSSFLLSDDSRYYCSELVLKALAKAGIQTMLELPGEKFILMEEPIILPDSITKLVAFQSLQ